MDKQNDFDLDLREVKRVGASAKGITTAACGVAGLTIKLTLANKCKSVESPTGGMTSACCKKKASVEPQCV